MCSLYVAYIFTFTTTYSVYYDIVLHGMYSVYIVNISIYILLIYIIIYITTWYV